MTILHVHGNHVPDHTEGISRNVASLVGALRSHAVDARLAAACQDLRALNRRRTLLRGSARARRIAAEAARAEPVRAIHAHVSLPSLARLAPRPTRLPALVHVWNAHAGAETPRTRGRLAHRLANGRTAARWGLKGHSDVVVSSRYQQAQLESLGYAGRIHCIPNGVDARRFRPATPSMHRAARAALGLPDGPTILYYGHLSPWKGWETFVAALPGVLRRHPEATAVFSVTSYGGRAGRLRAALARAGIARRCAVLGPEHVPTLHAAASAAVVPLRAAVGTACHPNVVLECLAAGLPLVATRVGSVPEVVEDGRTGLLVPPGDSGAIATALDRILSEPLLAGRLAAAARRQALRMEWSHTAHAMADLYERLGVASSGTASVAEPVPASLEVTA